MNNKGDWGGGGGAQKQKTDLSSQLYVTCCLNSNEVEDLLQIKIRNKQNVLH